MRPPRALTPQERRERLEARRGVRAEVTDPAVVMEAAAAFLSVRPRSVAETRRRLRHLGYQHGLVDEVVERLGELGYLDDEAFATAWVESRDRARPRGESVLRRELSLKGLDRTVVDAVMAARAGEDGMSTRAGAGIVASDAPDRGVSGAEERRDPDLVAATRLLEKKRAALMREPDERKRRQKAYALLARNGFDPEVCRSVAATIARRDDDGEA